LYISTLNNDFCLRLGSHIKKFKGLAYFVNTPHTKDNKIFLYLFILYVKKVTGE